MFSLSYDVEVTLLAQHHAYPLTQNHMVVDYHYPYWCIFMFCYLCLHYLYLPLGSGFTKTLLYFNKTTCLLMVRSFFRRFLRIDPEVACFKTEGSNRGTSVSQRNERTVSACGKSRYY